MWYWYLAKLIQDNKSPLNCSKPWRIEQLILNLLFWLFCIQCSNIGL